MTSMPVSATDDPLLESPDLQMIAAPTAPKLIDLLAQWQSWPKAGGFQEGGVQEGGAQEGGLPGRNRFEPADMPHLLPDLCLVEYDGHANPYRDYDILFRYIGSHIGDVFRLEQQTRQHLSSFGSQFAPRWFPVFDHQRRSRAPFAVKGVPYLVDKTYLRFELLFLPLARGDGAAAAQPEVAFTLFAAHVEANLAAGQLQY